MAKNLSHQHNQKTIVILIKKYITQTKLRICIKLILTVTISTITKTFKISLNVFGRNCMLNEYFGKIIKETYSISFEILHIVQDHLSRMMFVQFGVALFSMLTVVKAGNFFNAKFT